MTNNKIEFVTAKEIQKMDIPPINWAIENLIPEGLTLLTGRPKAGKSYMAFDIALSVANGNKFLGRFNSVQGKTLYLPYEDNARRVQGRINDVMNGLDAPENLLFPSDLQFPKIDDGGVEKIHRIIQDIPELRLIIIDTFGSAISQSFSHFGTSYKDDYEFMFNLQKMALDYQVGILLIHHTRKLISENVFDEVVGSTGVTASPDTIMMLRKSRGKVALHITGRDIKESNFEVRFDEDSYHWEIIADKISFAHTAERQEIVDLFESDPDKELKVKEITDLLGKSRESVSQILTKMKRTNEILPGSVYGSYKLPKPS
jgi:RecA-family ATPase